MLGDDHWTAHPEKGTTSHGTINGTSARDDRRHSVIGLAVRSEPAGSTTNRDHPGRIDRGRRLSHGRDAAQPPRLHGNGRFRGRQKIIQVIAYILMVVCLLACLLGLAAVFAPLIGLA